MEKLKYFFECYLHMNEGMDSLDRYIEEFKKDEKESIKYIFLNELYGIIQTKNYALASKFIEKYGCKTFNLEQTERILTYIYNRLLDKPAVLDTHDFYKDCKVVFCPVCTPDPENAIKYSLIEKATVIDKDLQIYICKPCKLVWLTEDIRADNAQDYKKFMKTVGLKGAWKELKDVDYL
ncbi:MAG TPA: hypothetical protein VKU36_04845 [Candidatus Babeliales bacterium]|nr:hypothetical protein [Candidatus Babeliales bacterium]